MKFIDFERCGQVPRAGDMEQQKENAQVDADDTDTSAALPVEPLFRALDASNVERVETSELESLCMSCGKTVSKLSSVLTEVLTSIITLCSSGHHQVATDQDPIVS